MQFDSDVFDHLGGAGIDYADGTQNSTISGDRIRDASAGGVLLGEVDDYYLADTALMTSGDVVTQNRSTTSARTTTTRSASGPGYTKNPTISNNDIGYTPYSGMSLGWGWGWQSDCTLQAKQGLSTPCRHGTNYAGGNQITDNFIHNVMGILHDGGPIYTNGGQGLGTGVSTALPADERRSPGTSWPTATAPTTCSTRTRAVPAGTRTTTSSSSAETTGSACGPRRSTRSTSTTTTRTTPAYYDNGTGITFNQATIVTDGAWPRRLKRSCRRLVRRASTDPPKPASSTTTASRSRTPEAGPTAVSAAYGDYDDGVHYTTTNGDSATLTFQGTQVSFSTETNADEGTFEVLVDGVNQGTFSASSTTRHTQQTLFTSKVLTSGTHTITVVKESGTYLLVDAFNVK